MNEPLSTRSPAVCENCGTVLIGGYCHVCGQHAHNPLKSVGHAVEEVFESFWHVDGRIFSTVRDLFIPGRVAIGYLSGQRVKYIAPLRLFIILSLLTFFVGKLTLHVEVNSTRTGTSTQREAIEFGGQALNNARTVDEVIKARDLALADIRETREDPLGNAIVSAFSEDAEAVVHKNVQKRLIELNASAEQLNQAAAAIKPAKTPAPAKKGAVSAEKSMFRTWLDGKVQRLRMNTLVAQKDPNTLIKLFLGAVPGALLMLMPVFALCLKLLYIRSGRGYLEHLVVAMYSHVFMLAVLLLTFIVIGLQSLIGGTALAPVFSGLMLGLLLPVYLLLMQKRVYAQSWLKTLAKYSMLGIAYSFLLIMALLYAIFAGLSS